MSYLGVQKEEPRRIKVGHLANGSPKESTSSETTKTAGGVKAAVAHRQHEQRGNRSKKELRRLGEGLLGELGKKAPASENGNVS